MKKRELQALRNKADKEARAEYRERCSARRRSPGPCYLPYPEYPDILKLCDEVKQLARTARKVGQQCLGPLCERCQQMGSERRLLSSQSTTSSALVTPVGRPCIVNH